MRIPIIDVVSDKCFRQSVVKGTLDVPVVSVLRRWMWTADARSLPRRYDLET